MIEPGYGEGGAVRPSLGRVAAIIQARSSSSRLPGKMLRSLHGRPLLDHVVEAARHVPGVDVVVVATSTEPGDDALAAHSAALKVAVYRGSLEDVARRMLEAAEVVGADVVIRINGDSPLLDPALVAHGLALFRSRSCDLASNVAVRSFPKGQSVEVISRAALARAVAEMTTAEEREHVTLHVYRHRERYDIAEFTADPPLPDLQLSVDTEEDFAACADLLAVLPDPPWRVGWRVVANLAVRHAAARENKRP